jgi:NAD(P)-dependent dehydrogenase (short-subunit alcohol dehydrogenase family)
MGNKLEGKIAVITGGGSGIGLATAKRFVSEGAYVFIIDRNKRELDSAISETGKNVMGIDGDISNLADLLLYINNTLSHCHTRHTPFSSRFIPRIVLLSTTRK